MCDPCTLQIRRHCGSTMISGGDCDRKSCNGENMTCVDPYMTVVCVCGGGDAYQSPCVLSFVDSVLHYKKEDTLFHLLQLINMQVYAGEVYGMIGAKSVNTKMAVKVSTCCFSWGVTIQLSCHLCVSATVIP